MFVDLMTLLALLLTLLYGGVTATKLDRKGKVLADRIDKLEESIKCHIHDSPCSFSTSINQRLETLEDKTIQTFRNVAVRAHMLADDFTKKVDK